MANGVPLEYKEITCLDFPEGKALFGRYNDSIAKYGEKARNVLGKFTLTEDGTMLGSNPFMAVQLASLGVQLATPAQLEKAVGMNPDFFRGKYEDIALVLRQNGDSNTANDFVAKHLYEQVSKRLGTTTTPETPARVSLKGLTLKEDANSQYGLVFVVGDEVEILAVPEFSNVNHGKRFLKTDERGIPIFDNSGNRIFYARNAGLSRLFLSRYLSLGSDGEVLANSDSDGRVPLVVSSVAGVPQNFPAQTAQADYKRHLNTLREVRAGNLPGSVLEGLIKEIEVSK